MGPLGELLQRSLTAFLVIIGSMGVAYILLRLSDKFHYAYVERQQSARAEGRPEPEERMFAEWALSTLSVVVAVAGASIAMYILTPETVIWLSVSTRNVLYLVLALPCIFLALFFYRLRRQFPFLYGAAEIVVAVLSIAVAISQLIEEASLAPLLLVLGGIYIFVRGMDNMDKGLPARMRHRWDIIFPSRDS